MIKFYVRTYPIGALLLASVAGACIITLLLQL